MKKRRFFESIVCFILALAIMCPMGIETKAAGTDNVVTIDETDADADDILNLEQIIPEEFEEYGIRDVYDSSKKPFLLSEQNELFLYRTIGKPSDKDSKAQAWYYNNAEMTIKRSNPKKDEYFVDSINNVNSGNKSISVSKDGFAFVEGVGFDPLIDGRKKYAGYVGYKDKSLYCFVIEANTGRQWSIKLNSMNWVDTYDPDYWQAANYLSITAGDFDGDKAESLIVCGIGDGSNLNVYEVKFDGKKLTSSTVLNLASTRTSTNEPILYDDIYKYTYKGNPNLKTPYGKDEKKYILRSRPFISLTAGDFDGDGMDELAFATGYNKARGGAKDGYSGNASNVEGFSTAVGITDLEGKKWSNPVTFYMYERTGSPKIKGKEETYNFRLKKTTKLRKNKIETLENTYYFSVACCSTIAQEDGTEYPDLSITEAMFARSSVLMGKYKGKTAGGFTIDETWRKNDGLVNTISARAPFEAPQIAFDPSCIEKVM